MIPQHGMGEGLSSSREGISPCWRRNHGHHTNVHSLTGCQDWTREGLMSSEPGFRTLSFGQHVASMATGDDDTVELCLFSPNT